MKKSILTEKQKLFLSLFSAQKIANKFYLTGGTALAEYYFPYRSSADLDFFSRNEIQIDEITAFIKSIKGKIG